MSKYMSFSKSSQYGDEGRKEVMYQLIEAGYMVKLRDEDGSRDLDITSPDVSRVEVKREDNYADSGNICVELAQGRPPRTSGIMRTESTVTIHLLGPRAAVYRTREMRELITKELEFNRLHPFICGDNYNQCVNLGVYRLRDSYRSWFSLCDRKQIFEQRHVLFFMPPQIKAVFKQPANLFGEVG